MINQLEEIAAAEKEAVDRVEEERRRLLREGERRSGEIEQRFREEAEKIEKEVKENLNKKMNELQEANRNKMTGIEKRVKEILIDRECRESIIGRMTEMIINSS